MFAANPTGTPLEDRRETVTFVIPVFNETEVLPELLREIERYRLDHSFVSDVLFVDDGSTDGTADTIRQLTRGLAGYHVISFSRNFGHQLAITAGLQHVTTDAAVILDADLQDPLHVVTEMVERWHEGYDVAYGMRRMRRGESLVKRATAALFYRFFRLMTDIEMPLDAGDFRLVSRRVIDAFKELKEQRPFVRALIPWLGFPQVAVPYDREKRFAGTPKYTYRKLVQMAIDGLASFSDKPLRIAVRVGLILAVVSGIGGAVWAVAAKYVFQSALSGWASLMMVIAFLGGLNLFFMGLVGSYIARVFDQTKERPRYVIADRWSSAAVTTRVAPEIEAEIGDR